MITNNFRRSVVALLLLTTFAPRAASAKPLPSDPRLVTGKLKNGVTWIYRKHDNPPGKMALMIHVDTGSLNETDAQRGLAHFMEHMCFNGTDNFPPGALIPYFESIGMEFGADLNAFTSFDQTSYMLFTPDTKVEQVDKALMVLSDYAFRATLLDAEIDKERGVILEEARARKSAFQRVRDKLWPELFEGSRFAQRLPIGDEGVIAKAPRSEFVDYYRSWYRPERVTLMLVGDADPEPYRSSIEKWFGEYKPDAAARKDMSAEFKPFTKQRALVVTDPEMALCRVQMENLRPGRPAITTTEQWRTQLVEEIGNWIMGRRFDTKVKKGEASFRGANTSVQSFFQEGLMISSQAQGEAKDWNKMLDELVMEVQRARQFGFTNREFALARKEMRSEYEHNVKREPSRNARGVIMQINGATNEGEPVLSAQQELDLFNETIASIDVGEVSKAFAANFATDSVAFVVTTSDKDASAVPSRDDVLAAAKSALARKVEPIKEEEQAASLLATAPTPGKVTETAVEKELEITSGWLSNGVRVHHRYMDYKKDTVLATISLAGAQVEETPENAGITDAACLAINEAATNTLSSSQVRDLMTGKNIRVIARPAGDTLMINLEGSPADLEAGLQEVYAVLTDGKIEEAAFNNWKLQLAQRLEMMDKAAQFRTSLALLELLGGGDPRLTPMTKEKLEKQTLAAAQAWWDRHRKDSAIEVAVVGDISWDQVRPLLETYLGSLSQRKRTAENLDKLRKLPRSTGPLVKAVQVDTMTPQAVALVGFVTPEGRNKTEVRALELATETVTSRLVKRIREEKSLVYSISARNSPSWVYNDTGQFFAGAPCDPDKVSQVIDEAQTVFAEFAEKGPTAEELDNAKKQVAEDLDTDMREPGYWLSILQHHDMHKRDLKEEKAEKEAYPKFSAEQVRDTFKKYYTPARQFQVTAVPTGAKAGEAKPADAKPTDAKPVAPAPQPTEKK